MTAPTIGVLALQGDVREHLAALGTAGAHPVSVRRPAELAAVDGLVLPGGESSTIGRLLATFDLLDDLRERIRAGLPVYGSCAGMVLLADRVPDAAGPLLGGMDVTVRRNAFGRQVDSFEEDLHAPGLGTGDGPLRAVYIRAPWVEEAGAGVDVLARVSSGPAAGRIVAARQGALLATAFHPEISGDARVHRVFVDMVRDHLATPVRRRPSGDAPARS
ncbi:pyridoxal 5'-phosphate synthase glutaminase subunit PdxT [Georgenia sp. H159]|uniref:pyridoxal 5'-phosphate synthase glutaminase subunit PdxT n=1 Tax=Georgenia sp. H159 TaxID=3076115 RepID=UPI002D79388F|nr:pyridoxal 5'-phosphate synthase glutaminase subunit PdxT [Georgenia sp. H159]